MAGNRSKRNTKETDEACGVSDLDSKVTDTQEMFTIIRDEIASMRTAFTERMDTMEKTLSAQITENLETYIEDVVSEKIAPFNAELTGKINQLEDKVQTFQTRCEKDISLNIAIKNLPVTTNEQLQEKVNDMIKTGMKLGDVKVTDVKRKKAYSDKVPGIVIATCKSDEDKNKIMKNKAKLKENAQFEKVFLDHDKDRSTRIQEANWRSVIKTVGSDSLFMKGDRVLVRNNSETPGSVRSQTSNRGRGRGRGRGGSSNRNSDRGATSPQNK